MTKRTAPHERALSPRVPRRGKGRSGADPKCPHSRWCRRVRPSPAQRSGRRQEARLRCRGPRPPLKPLRQPLGRWGSIQWPLALREAPKELQAPKRRLPPSKVCIGFLIFLLIVGCSLSSDLRYPFISRKHKAASVELAPQKAVKRGARSTPGSARPKSPPP